MVSPNSVSILVLILASEMLMHLEDSDDFYCVDIDFEPYPRVPGSSGFCSQLPPRSLRSSLFLHTLLSRYRACHSQEAL